jgi:hypothetical protein
MAYRGYKVFGLLLLVLAAGSPPPAQANFLNDIANGISSAANTVSNGLSTAANATANGLAVATNATGNAINTAVTATGNGLNIAVNATNNGLRTAANATYKWVTTAVADVNDAYNVSSSAIRNFTSDARNSLAPAANNIGNTVTQLGNSIYNVSAGAVNGVVDFKNQAETAASPADNSSTPMTEIDATSASSIIAGLTRNATGFVPVANSLLVAIGQNKSTDVENAIRNIINNQTGETSYPTTAVNSTVGLGLAEAVVTAFVTAKNYTVTVNFQGQNVTINSSQVLDVFIAGLQDGLTPCAKNVTSNSTATSGTPEYFSSVASGCCYLVAQPLTNVVALGQSNGGTSDVNAALSRSQSLGQAPSLDLTRCLSNSTATS